MGDVCMTCGVHGMWCTLHEELHGFSQHDIDNVRVAWQCSFKTVQTLCFKMALVVHGGQRVDLCRCTPPWRKQCAYCIWGKLGPQWQTELRDSHRKNGQPYICPIISDTTGGNFAVGCSVCRDAGNMCNFGQFNVRTPAYMQMVSFRRHIDSPKHIAVCERLGIEVIIRKTSVKRLESAALAPQSSLFLWGLTTTFTNSSYRSFRKFHQSAEVQQIMAQSNRRNVMSTDSEPMPVASEVNMQPEHVRTCKQVACAMSCVLDVADRSIMKRSVRMSMAADDCDQTRLMMFKMVTANPIIQVHSCVAAIIRDPGHGIDDAVKATMDGINQSCVVRVGPLDKDTLESSASYVDTTLEQHIHKVMVSAASDGCEVEVQAVQKLRSTNKLPNLRYFFRDTCHTIGCTAKMITKYLKHDDTALLEILVTGKGSFAKRVQYSRAFQARWVAKQKADIGALLNICKNLGFNETRYHSRTDPMCNLMGHWSACLDVLVDVSTSDLASSDEAKWAAYIVQECAGLKGFQRLVSFSVECDFFHNLSEAVKVHDAKKMM